MVPTNVISRSALVAFWRRHPDAEASLSAWYVAVSGVEWTGPEHLASTFGTTDFLADQRVVFNIGGNKFRVVARFAYRYKSAMIKFVGTHAEYDRYDAARVGNPNVPPTKQKRR